MTNTKTLFDRPLSHTNDPGTSYEAADKMIKSGALSRQEKFVWHWICNYIYNGHKDFTPKEVAKWLTIDAEGNYEKIYYTIQRRLSGLRHKGKIERTAEKRDGCCVWRIIAGSD